MRKKWMPAAFLGLSLLLSACSSSQDREGIGPCDLSEQEVELLEAFGIRDTSQILTFKAPKGAITVSTNVYQLTDDGAWEVIGDGQISIGKEREPVDFLEGSFVMQLRKDYGIDFRINCAGQASYETEGTVMKQEPLASTRGFLQEFKTIELNTEIPVAVMVYDSGTSMQSCGPDDYYEPEKFEGMDLVQAVTLEFSDEEI